MSALPALTGSRLIDALNFRYLKPVRHVGAVIHLVPRDGVANIIPAKSLCGQVAPCTDRGTPRWRLVHAPGGKVCATCHAKSCSEPSRIDWS